MREVTEADFRQPEYRDAKVEDYEFREDGTLVRKDRWETGVRAIVGVLEDAGLGGVTRRNFEIGQVVEAVKQAVNNPTLEWAEEELTELLKGAVSRHNDLNRRELVPTTEDYGVLFSSMKQTLEAVLRRLRGV